MLKKKRQKELILHRIDSQPVELPASTENWTTSWKRNLLRVNKYIETITKKVWEFIKGCIMSASCFLVLFRRHHILTHVRPKIHYPVTDLV